MQNILLYILIIAILILSAVSVPAAQINGVYFHNSVTVGDEVLKIRGAGILKWLFFKVYVVALYLPPEVEDGHALDDIPKKMEFHYLSDMKAERFTESGDALLKKNASADELAQIRGKIDAINDMYRDVKKGDRYSLTYMPGKGTELALNDEVLGLIKGYDFAAIYYRIWLGESPVDDDLKNKLLNNDGRIFSSK